MGQIRTPDCEIIDEEMRRVCMGGPASETRQDEYSEDFIVWITVSDEIHSIRVTLDEYRDGCWRDNVRLAADALAGKNTGE